MNCSIVRIVILVFLFGPSSLASGQSLLFTLDNGKVGDRFGTSVAIIGDVNYDTYSDILVGAPYSDDPTVKPYVEVYSGKDGSIIPMFSKEGDEWFDWFGISVSAAGDVNQDLVPDFVVGAMRDYTPAPPGSQLGYARVISGADGSELYTVDGGLDGSPQDFFGDSVSRIGDVDGDGVDDLVVGARQGDEFLNDDGIAFIVSGKSGTVLAASWGDNPSDLLGNVVSGIGDANNDGIPDFAVGAYNGHITPGGENPGYVRAFSGKDFSILWTVMGDVSGDLFGNSVGMVGDANGDGFSDVVVGAPGDPNSPFRIGYVRVFSGIDGSLLWEQRSLSQDDQFGFAVTGVRDLDGDGYDDVAVGAPNHDNDGISKGRVYVYSGQTGAFLYDLVGEAGADAFGHSLASSDLTKDGKPDLVVGSPGASSKVYVFSGTCEDVDASWSNYGSGWPGYHGVPTLTAESNPIIGTTVTIDITCSARQPARSLYYLFVGLDQADYPTQLGGRFLVGTIFLTLADVFDVSGIAGIDGDIPNDPVLCGLHLYGQALETDPVATKGISFTPGIDLLLGN